MRGEAQLKLTSNEKWLILLCKHFCPRTSSRVLKAAAKIRDESNKHNNSTTAEQVPASKTKSGRDFQAASGEEDRHALQNAMFWGPPQRRPSWVKQTWYNGTKSKPSQLFPLAAIAQYMPGKPETRPWIHASPPPTEHMVWTLKQSDTQSHATPTCSLSYMRSQLPLLSLGSSIHPPVNRKVGARGHRALRARPQGALAPWHFRRFPGLLEGLHTALITVNGEHSKWGHPFSLGLKLSHSGSGGHIRHRHRVMQ